MSDGLPDERRLRAVEQQVLTRIRRRAAIRTRVASSVAGVAVLVGAVVLVQPVLSNGFGTFGSSGSGGGTAAGSSSSQAYSEDGIRCHETSATGSAVTIAPLPAHAGAASVAAACAAVLPKAADGTSDSSTSPPASALVVCRAKDGRYEVFPKDARPGTLCSRNGLAAG